MPSKGEVTVFRVDGLNEHHIWEIGRDIAQGRKRTLYARGDTRAHDVRKADLDVSPLEPPPRHAIVIGWPENNKPRQKLMALQIAAAATIVLKD